jgi:hypothetical protein
MAGMIAKRICHDCSIMIKGRIFLANLIVLDLHDFDIILGMDWLAKNHAVIDCHKKKATLHTPNRQKITYQGGKKRKVECLLTN